MGTLIALVGGALLAVGAQQDSQVRFPPLSAWSLVAALSFARVHKKGFMLVTLLPYWMANLRTVDRYRVASFFTNVSMIVLLFSGGLHVSSRRC